MQFSKVTPPKTASQIQAIVLAELSYDNRATRIIVDETISFSDESDDETATTPAKFPTSIVKAVMTRSAFIAFRENANAQGIWVKAVYEPLGLTGRFVYTLIATPLRQT